jgi:transposase
MRGSDEETGALFSYQNPESLVPSDHPLRAIRVVVNGALERLSPEFSKLYSPYGRASIAPEKRLRALLIQAFFGIRSERQLMEQSLPRRRPGYATTCCSAGSSGCR